MLTFMDHMLHAFGTSTGWNHDNSYSSLTATSDALLSFQTPSTLCLNVSSLSTPNFATSYTLSTLGQIDGSVSYLYTSQSLAHIPAQSPSIPLRYLVRGYRELSLPKLAVAGVRGPSAGIDGRKPTLAYATLALPPPTVLTALYARRIDDKTLLSLSLYSKSMTTPTATSSPPPASVLAHAQHDAGQYSVEALASTDSLLLGARALWNFGVGAPSLRRSGAMPDAAIKSVQDSPNLILPAQASIPSPQDELAAYHSRLASRPNLLSAGAEFYYSPFSHVIGMSTGLRFTALAPHIGPAELHPGRPLAGTSASLLAPSNIAHSSFPYTMTLTLNPIVGSIASTYSVRPTPNLALSSRCDFNFYSWESRYVVGAEIWRGKSLPSSTDDPLAWARLKLRDWFSSEEKALKDERLDRENENVVKLRVDDSWKFKALWTGRVKSLLVSAGVSVSPLAKGPVMVDDRMKRWTGTVGISVAYST
jgi:mitochondrial distribution and morphology protein 10